MFIFVSVLFIRRKCNQGCKLLHNFYKFITITLTMCTDYSCLMFFFPETEKQSRMAALLERLHAKHNASRPWQETCKVVRQAMVRLL